MKTPVLILLLGILLCSVGLTAEERLVFGGLNGLDPAQTRPPYRVLLALSGGGVRGLASVGVLRAFEEKGIEVAGIAGTSMGGIVGGLYAAGYSPHELETITRELDFAALFENAPPRSTMLQTRRRDRGRDLLTVRFDGFKPRIPQAITSAQYLTNFLTLFTARATYQSSGDFQHLRIPFAAVSTDVVTGEKVVLRAGSLADAMRATMAFPLAFTGLDIDGQLLMDGGMVDPIPVGIARELSESVDFVVAINTASPLVSRKELITPFDIADQVTTIMTADRLRQSLREADYVITPTSNGIRSTDYRYVDSLITLGYTAGLRAADSIMMILDDRRDSACITVIDVQCSDLPGPYRPILHQALLGQRCTRLELRDRCRELAGDTGLFLLEATLKPVTADSGIENPHIMYLTGYECFAPGSVEFRFLGNTKFMDTTLVRVLGLKDSLVTPQRLKQGTDRIRNLYLEKGWDLMCIRETLVEADRRLITFVIDEAIIYGIEVEGVGRTRPWYIRSHFPLETGEPFSTRGASDGLRNIYGTDLFDRVTVDLVPDEGRPMVHVRIEEKAYRQVRLGWHWDDEYESEEFIELADDHIGGFGLEGLLHARYSPDRQDYHVGFKADRIFKTYLTSRVRAYYTLLDRHLFFDEDSTLGKRAERKAGMEVRLGQQIARLGTVSAGLIIEEVEYDIEQDDLPEEKFGLRIIELESLVETFDRLPFTQSGKKHYFELQQAGKLVGGDAEYTRFFTSIEAYFPVCEHFTYHPKIAVGLSRPDLPWSERFYLGGMDSFAGYRTFQHAGNRMFLMSNELRLQLPLRLYLSARYDMGDVYESTDEMKVASLRHGVGACLALDMPLGPFEIGYGVAGGADRFYLRAGFEF